MWRRCHYIHYVLRPGNTFFERFGACYKDAYMQMYSQNERKVDETVHVKESWTVDYFYCPEPWFEEQHSARKPKKRRHCVFSFLVAMNNCGTDYLCIVVHRVKQSTIHLPGLHPIDLSWSLNMHGRKMSSPSFNFYGSSGYLKPCPGEY